MEKLSVTELREVCAQAWDVPECEVSLLLTPRSTEVVHTRGTSVRVLVRQEHGFSDDADPAEIIVEAAAKEIDDVIPLRRDGVRGRREDLARAQHRLADAVSLRQRVRSLLGLPDDPREAEAVVHPALVVMETTEMQRVVDEAGARAREAGAVHLEERAAETEAAAGQGDVPGETHHDLCQRAATLRLAAAMLRQRGGAP